VSVCITSCATPRSLTGLLYARALIAGGGAPEIHVSRLLSQYAQTLKGMESYCFQAYADALEVIPTTLAENAGLNPIAIVTELRNRHAMGEKNAGINVRKVCSAVALCIGCLTDAWYRGLSRISWRRTSCSRCWCRRAQLSSLLRRSRCCSRWTIIILRVECDVPIRKTACIQTQASV
jgi:hypothetical protein